MVIADPNSRLRGWRNYRGPAGSEESLFADGTIAGLRRVVSGLPRRQQRRHRYAHRRAAAVRGLLDDACAKKAVPNSTETDRQPAGRAMTYSRHRAGGRRVTKPGTRLPNWGPGNSTVGPAGSPATAPGMSLTSEPR